MQIKVNTLAGLSILQLYLSQTIQLISYVRKCVRTEWKQRHIRTVQILPGTVGHQDKYIMACVIHSWRIIILHATMIYEA